MLNVGRRVFKAAPSALVVLLMFVCFQGEIPGFFSSDNLLHFGLCVNFICF